MRWYDYFYTEEGALLCSYGIEGESFEYDDTGKPQFTEVVYNNPDGLSLNDAIALYACVPAQASWYNWERELVPTTSENVWNTKELFEGNWVDEYTMPQITLTADESMEYAQIMTDVLTYLSENIVKFITGQKSMDEYDSMLAELKSMGVDRATEIQQAALNRFYARKS